MKIFYAVQATGNGHISRAAAILSQLKQYSDVDIFLSGSNSHLSVSEDVKYRSKGLSLFYGNTGRLNYGRIAASCDPVRIFREVASLPVEKYDLVINDYEALTSLACRQKNVRSVGFGHQASFISNKVPRPEIRSVVGEFLLKNYARSSMNCGLHFEEYDDFILPPIIREEIFRADPCDEGHVTVYLPSYSDKYLAKFLNPLRKIRFHIFSKEVSARVDVDNLSFRPIEKTAFTESFVNCRCLLSSAGFETPAEALYLGKPMLLIPIRGQYEQQCNAAALQRFGVTILNGSMII